MRLRYKKVINDLKTDLTKNMMLVMAIAIGVFGIGTILGAYAVLKKEMARNYMGTNPASATIELEGVSVKRSLIDSVKMLPGIKSAVRHKSVYARMKIGDEWHPLLLSVIDDFKNVGTNITTPVSGATIPPTGSLLVERTALPVMQAEIGETIVIQLPHAAPTEIIIAGTVHDPGFAPARQEQTGYGYLSLETLQQVGGEAAFDEIRVVFDNSQKSIAEATNKSRQVASFLEKNGYTVHEIQVPPPRKHPHQGQMNAILILFTLFSFMILILSSILVSTSISTLMVKQVREIGIMKTIGAGSHQISALYIFMIVSMSLVAITIAIPLSGFAASLFYNQISVLLNLEIFDSSIPGWVTITQVISGVLIPLLVALFPVLQGSRITVREAMDNYGVSGQEFGKGFIERQLTRLQLFGESFTLSIRNVFRKRSRLIMTLALLSAGGAMFVAALNISKAWDANLSKMYKYRHYDFEVQLNDPIDTDDILKKIKNLPGINGAEAWGVSMTAFTSDVPYEINHMYPDKGHGSFIMLGLPQDSKVLSLPLLAGCWLSTEKSNEVVLNQVALAANPDIQVGDVISLSVNHQSHQWRVVGFVEDIGSPGTAFVSLQTYRDFTGMENKANMLRISFNDRSPKAAKEKIIEIEKLLSDEQVSVYRSLPIALLHNAMAEHMGVLINSLLALSFLLGLVGALGLMSAMSMNVIERTREIGVLRAIGATPKKIRSLLIGEGLISALGSLVIAFVVGMILSYYIGQLVGDMAFRTPLPLSISWQALMIWIFIIVIGSIGATVFPARRAVGITTHEALSYE